MERRRLGTSDLYLSVLGIGCWQFGDGAYWGSQDQKDVDAVVHQALDEGINYFDTAEVYNDGESEKSLGIALKGNREKAVIGSKISTSNMYPSALRAHCEASLKRLQTDYIDLYMVHWPLNQRSVLHFTNDKELISHPPNVQESFGALAELRKEGKIRHIGISNHGVEQMKEVMSTGVSFIANELAYNLFSRAIEESILPFCIANQTGVIGYMPLQQGLLAGKYTSLDEIKPMQARSRHFHYNRGEGTRHGEEGAEAEITQAIKEIRQIADELNVPLTVLSLAWVIANQGITSTIVGSRNEKQLITNVHGVHCALSPEYISRLNQITEPVWRKLGSNPDYYENIKNSRIY